LEENRFTLFGYNAYDQPFAEMHLEHAQALELAEERGLNRVLLAPESGPPWPDTGGHDAYIRDADGRLRPVRTAVFAKAALTKYVVLEAEEEEMLSSLR
jgi:hypothetical protein